LKQADRLRAWRFWRHAPVNSPEASQFASDWRLHFLSTLENLEIPHERIQKLSLIDDLLEDRSAGSNSFVHFGFEVFKIRFAANPC